MASEKKKKSKKENELSKKKNELFRKIKDLVTQFRHYQFNDNPNWAKRGILAVITSAKGFFLGTILVRAQLFSAQPLVDFQNPALLTFLTSQLSSQMIFNTITWLRDRDASSFEYIRRPWTRPMNLWSVGSGTFLQGLGVVLSNGRLPIFNLINMALGTTEMVVLGFAYLGGQLLGCYAYAYYEDFAEEWKEDNGIIRNRHSTFDKKLNISYGRLALTLGLAGGVATGLYDSIFPWWSFSGHLKSGPLAIHNLLSGNFAEFAKTPLPPILAGICAATLSFSYTYLTQHRDLSLTQGVNYLAAQLCYPIEFKSLEYYKNGRYVFSLLLGVSVVAGAAWMKMDSGSPPVFASFWENLSLQQIYETGSNLTSYLSDMRLDASQSPPISSLLKVMAGGFLYQIGSLMTNDVLSVNSASYLSQAFVLAPLTFLMGTQTANYLIQPLFWKFFE